MKVEWEGSSESREMQRQAAFMQMPISSLFGQRAKGQDRWIVEALLKCAANKCCAVWVLESQKHALCNTEGDPALLLAAEVHILQSRLIL